MEILRRMPIVDIRQDDSLFELGRKALVDGIAIGGLFRGIQALIEGDPERAFAFGIIGLIMPVNRYIVHPAVDRAFERSIELMLEEEERKRGEDGKH